MEGVLGVMQSLGRKSVCVCVFPAALLCFFRKKKTVLNTKECVTGTYVQAAGPLETTEEQEVRGIQCHCLVQVLTRRYKSSRLRGASGRTAAGLCLLLHVSVTGTPLGPNTWTCPDSFTNCLSCKRNSSTRVSGEIHQIPV